ncbi:MAG: hypothetical protein ACFFFC_08065 [Candidatus Thorarchaeota archaeon]
MIRRRKKPQEVPPPNPFKALLEFTEADERYVNMMLRKTAMRTLTKHRKNPQLSGPPAVKPEVHIDPEIDRMLHAIETKMGLHRTPVVPIRNCRKCYFSSAFRMIGNDWYSLCTNIARAPSLQRGKWVHCESNLSCWRAP